MGFADKLAEVLRNRELWAREVLGRLIAIPSLSGEEGRIQTALFDLLRDLGFPARLSPIDEAIAADPDYTAVSGLRTYEGRPNVLVTLPGSGGGRSLLLNTHTDVVPGSATMFEAATDGGTVRGRGACDAKGQVVTLLLALVALRELGLDLRGGLEAQFVIEEEAGGNGSLATIVGGSRADAAVVLEPTGLGVCPANRGAAWFNLTVTGRSVHMGRYHEGVNAFEEMIGLVRIIKAYEAFLRSASKGTSGFPDEPSPVVVNIGRARAGDWPSTVAGECVVEGGIAFLPNRTARRVEAEVRDLIEARATPWAREHARFALAGLRNEAFATPADHPAVALFRGAAASVLGPRPVEGWNASCDARLFFHRGGMPTIVFGAGDLRHAHAADERIEMRDVLAAADVLTRFVVSWCGIRGEEGENAR